MIHTKIYKNALIQQRLENIQKQNQIKAAKNKLTH